MRLQRLLSMHVLTTRFWRKKNVTDSECWEWTAGCNHDGYGRLSWSHGLVQRFGGERAVHRIAWILTFGPIPAGKLVTHKCDNPPCFNPEHLILGTEMTNMRDKSKKGRHRNQWTSGFFKQVSVLPAPPPKL